MLPSCLLVTHMKRRIVVYSTLAIFILASAALLLGEDLFIIPDHWTQHIPNAGSSSSPRAVDLTGDGILDIVIGAGGKEFSSTEYGVIALDGENGALLWTVPARDQVVGSPAFKDLNNDKTPDVIIGGRSAILYAINGRSGALFWEFLPTHDSLDIVNDRSILNFYNPQFIPDQDGDRREDILIAYGGFIKAPPGQTNRPAGSLMAISSRDGSVLAKANVPDGRETYMSPVLYDFDGDGERSVLFGSGGETINGHFYKAGLSNVLEEDLSKATVLADGEGKGFIAPPVLADVNGDEIKDIVVSSVKGRVLCIDGATERLLWEADLGDEFEGYATPSPGKFNKDNVPDFFVSAGHGVWPNMDFAYQVVVDGKDGSIVFRDTAGTFQYASPLTFDFTEDGRDDALVVVNNEQRAEGTVLEKKYTNEVRVFDPHNRKAYRFLERKTGSNLGSTPLLTDLDGDQYLDIVYCYMDDPSNFFSFKSATIERIETRIQLDGPIRWGEYMGARHNGAYINHPPIGTQDSVGGSPDD